MSEARLVVPVGVGEMVTRRLTPEPERPLPTDPVRWVREQLEEHLWSVQRQILQALQDHRKVAVASCHGIGKSYTAARAGAWWIAGHPPNEAKFVSTAPSGDQVRSILWGELQRAHTRGGLPGHITRGSVPEWIVGGEQVAFGRKPSDFKDPEKARTQFQGIHARYLLGILDEAAGIPPWLWDAMETLVTNEASRLLAIGNPTDPTTEFAKKCQPGSGWHVIHVSAFDTPNFTGEAVPEQLRESLVSKLWVEERAKEWGEENPLYIAKVLGQFPETADDVIITPRMVREAQERDLSGYALHDKGRFGMDVARQGEDESCVYRNRGGMVRLVDAWRIPDIDVSRRRAEAIMDATSRQLVMAIDVVGLGWGIFDPMRANGYKVVAFEAGNRARNPKRFVNRTAEAWWGMRELMEAGLIDLDPEDDLLAAQLQSRKWKEDAAGKRIEVEKKEKMKSRGVPSPDRADGAVIAVVEDGGQVGDPEKILDALEEDARETDLMHGLMDLPT